MIVLFYMAPLNCFCWLWHHGNYCNYYYFIIIFCSYYCGENPETLPSTQTHRRHQIRGPLSPVSSNAGHHQKPSPSKSDIIVSSHFHESGSYSPPSAASVMTERILSDESVEYEENTRTWPRKRDGRRHRQHGVSDDNDAAARLIGNQQDAHKDSDRIDALQHDYKSAETVFTTDEMQQYKSTLSSSAAVAAAAAKILSAGVTVPSYNQYSVNSPPTTASYSVQQQFNTTVCNFHDAPAPSLFSYSSSSPYGKAQAYRSQAAGFGTSPDDGRHAVDVLFDSLYQSSPPQNQPDAVSTDAPRTFPISPYVPALSPYVTSCYLISDHHSQAADLSTANAPFHSATTNAPFHSAPTASDTHTYQR